MTLVSKHTSLYHLVHLFVYFLPSERVCVAVVWSQQWVGTCSPALETELQQWDFSQLIYSLAPIFMTVVCIVILGRIGNEIPSESTFLAE